MIIFEYVTEPRSDWFCGACVPACRGGSRKWGWQKGSCCCLRRWCLKGVGFECLRTEPGNEGVTERIHKRRYLDVWTRCIRTIVNARHVYVWFRVKGWYTCRGVCGVGILWRCLFVFMFINGMCDNKYVGKVCWIGVRWMPEIVLCMNGMYECMWVRV